MRRRILTFCVMLVAVSVVNCYDDPSIFLREKRQFLSGNTGNSNPSVGLSNPSPQSIGSENDNKRFPDTNNGNANFGSNVRPNTPISNANNGNPSLPNSGNAGNPIQPISGVGNSGGSSIGNPSTPNSGVRPNQPNTGTHPGNLPNNRPSVPSASTTPSSQSTNLDNNGCPLPNLDNKRKCCRDSYGAEKENDQLKRYKRECVDGLPQHGKKGRNGECKTRPKEDDECLRSCIARKQGLLASNGEIDKAKAKTVVKQELAKKDWSKQASDRIVDQCADEANRQSKKRNRDNSNCKTATKFYHCLSRKFDRECPSTSRRSGAACRRQTGVDSSSEEN